MKKLTQRARTEYFKDQGHQPEIKASKDKQGNIIISGGTEVMIMCVDHFEGPKNGGSDDINWN